MYPYPIFFGIPLYWIFTALGMVAALFVLRFFGDRVGMAAEVVNLSLIMTVAAYLVGYPASVLMQAVYNYLEQGVFSLSAATFYGGLLGGAGCFLIGYFGIGGRVCRDGIHKRQFFLLSDVAACAIPLGHAFGRLGCFMAGCCYGKPTDAWFGIYMVQPGYRVIPTQLLEALFLLALFGVLSLRTLRRRPFGLPIYMAGYGIFRFCVEYLRDDPRGSSGIPFLTPSQLTAILLILGGAALLFWEDALCRKNGGFYEKT